MGVCLRSGTMGFNLEYNNLGKGYIRVKVNSVGGKAIILTFILNESIQTEQLAHIEWIALDTKYSN